MASIKIHQDIYRFEKKYTGLGLTKRGLAAVAVALGIFIAAIALFWWLLELPYQAVITLAFILAMPVAATGFLPVFNMPFEEFASRCLAHVSRGPYLFDAQPQRHVVKKDKAYIKTTRCRHCECGSAQRSA